ncbi:MAG: hypothetical protein ACOC2C_08340 [Cyclonatronaceae bacterium]
MMEWAGLLFILLSVGCSLLLAHLLKLAEVKGDTVLNVLTVNYIIAFASAVAMNKADGLALIPAFPAWFWAFCAFIGFIFIANFFLLSRSIHENGVGVSISAMRVSLLLPVLLSIAFYGEALSFFKMMGILLVFVAMGLFIAARRDVRLRGLGNSAYLLLLFLFSGTADASLKIYEEEMSGIASEAHLMGAIFMFSFLFGVAAIFKTKSVYSFTPREAWLGLCIGVPNLLSSVFVIRAFAYYDASIVYSVVNMCVITGGALIGWLYWKDDISRLEAMGIFTAILAIGILTQF